MKKEAGKNGKVTVTFQNHSVACLKKIIKKTRRIDGEEMNYTDAAKYAVSKAAEEMMEE